VSKEFRNRVVPGQRRSCVTENVYGGVVFEGVCTDLSNAAYPVEEVRERVEADFDAHENTAIHLALTLLHHGFVERTDGGGFALSDEAEELADDGALFETFCRRTDVRPRSEEDLARFASFFDEVVVAVTVS